MDISFGLSYGSPLEIFSIAPVGGSYTFEDGTSYEFEDGTSYEFN